MCLAVKRDKELSCAVEKNVKAISVLLRIPFYCSKQDITTILKANILTVKCDL